MPDLGGVDAARELPRIRPNLPVLLASGYSEEEGEELLAREGVCGFLGKPFTIEELRRKIRAALELETPPPRPGPSATGAGRRRP